MPVRIKPITLWRAEVDNQPGALARLLEPLASVKADLKVVMGYRLPGDHTRAAIEIYPVMGTVLTSAAHTVGLSESRIGALLIEGQNRPGLGHAVTSRLASAGINIDFLVTQVSGGQYSTVIGFDNADDAARAVPLIKQATAAATRPAVRKRASKARSKSTSRTRKRIPSSRGRRK